MRTNPRSGVLPGCAVFIALCAATLAGCDYFRHDAFVPSTSIASPPAARTAIPQPVSALLVAPAEPDCKLSDPNADDRQKLDYERQCYRHAEMIVRTRLRLLQAGVRRMARAADRCQWYAAQPGGLARFDTTGVLTE
jgi:hypothetical protein